MRAAGEEELPLMTSPEGRATMDVLTAVLAPVTLTDQDLLFLVVCRMATLSLEYGNSDGSTFIPTERRPGGGLTPARHLNVDNGTGSYFALLNSSYSGSSRAGACHCAMFTFQPRSSVLTFASN